MWGRRLVGIPVMSLVIQHLICGFFNLIRFYHVLLFLHLWYEYDKISTFHVGKYARMSLHNSRMIWLVMGMKLLNVANS